MQHKIIRVVMEVDYIVPMANDTISTINGWTMEEIVKEWFVDYDINRHHATRDIHRVGNGSKIISTEVVDV